MLKLSGNLTSTTAIGDAGEYVAPPVGEITNIQGLFTNNEGGFWFDPSDSSTLFEDVAGTTAATKGGKVGKILDKSGNGNHLTSRVTTKNQGASDEYVEDMRPTYGSEPTTGVRQRLINGETFKTTSGNTDPYLRGYTSQTGLDGTFTNVTTPSYATEHTTLKAANAQRVLSVENNGLNLPTASFTLLERDNNSLPENPTVCTFSVWVSEYTAQGNASAAYINVSGQAVFMRFSDGKVWDGSAWVTTETKVDSSGNNVVFSSDAHGSWYRIKVTFTSTASGIQTIAVWGSNGTDYLSLSSGSGFYFMAPQIEVGSSATAYQHRPDVYNTIETGATYIEYLAFEEKYTYFTSPETFWGTLLEKPSGVSLSATDEMTLLATVQLQKPNWVNTGLEDDRTDYTTQSPTYDQQTVVEFSDAANSNVGFRLRGKYVESPAESSYNYGSNGGIFASRSTTPLTLEQTYLITCQSDISDDQAKIRIDGGSDRTQSGEQGTATDYATNSLNIGARGLSTSAANPLFAKVFQVVGRGKETNATDLGNIETIVAAKGNLTV